MLLVHSNPGLGLGGMPDPVVLAGLHMPVFTPGEDGGTGATASKVLGAETPQPEPPIAKEVQAKCCPPGGWRKGIQEQG